ncbi:hypothetical protein MRX96_045476 [Rhipicephalus microplus]
MRKLGDNEKSGWKKKQSEKKRKCHATDEAIQPQLRSSEGAGSSGHETTQPPMEGASESYPSHTFTVVASGNEEPQTAASAAPEKKILVGAREGQQPKSARSRLAAIERVLAPEVAARTEALKTGEQRKAQLHGLELHLHKQQLLHQ